MDLGISGRVAVVAGASQGIGREIALGLAREGVDVLAVARSAERLTTLAGEVTALGRRCHVAAVDVSDRTATRIALDAGAAVLGEPTILVLAVAAVYRPEKLQFVDAGRTDELLAVDLRSQVELCQWALPHMMQARWGRIVGVGSLAARTGVAGGALYAAAKAGLEGLMRGLAVDYGRRGITANVVAPSLARTERLVARIAGDPDHEQKLERATASRRIPEPREIADVVTFLCSERAGAITGAVVDATAGAHLNNLW
ncbi:MAG: SDR family oxidoreductase [Myxococcales bacterium]|nr:SDR family oxidoreductase [Myxococcales bacterium]